MSERAFRCWIDSATGYAGKVAGRVDKCAARARPFLFNVVCVTHGSSLTFYLRGQKLFAAVL